MWNGYMEYMDHWLDEHTGAEQKGESPVSFNVWAKTIYAGGIFEEK